MLLGATYAQFVGAIGFAILMGSGNGHDPSLSGYKDLSVSLGATAHHKSGPGKNGFLTATIASHDLIFDRFTPIYAVGMSMDGAAFTSVGIGKRFSLLGFDVLPHFSPTLYQSRLLGEFSTKELIQFRTGIDISYAFNESMSFGAGFYHISNAGISTRSAGIDVTHIGLLFRY